MATKCFYHPREDATTQCESCKLSICDQCELENLCRDCRNKRRAIADRQRRARIAQGQGAEVPQQEPAPDPVSRKGWKYEPEKLAYRKFEAPVVHKRPPPTLKERLFGLDARLVGVGAALVVAVGLASFGPLGAGGEGEAPPEQPAELAAAPAPAAVVTPVPPVTTPDHSAEVAVWQEARSLASSRAEQAAAVARREAEARARLEARAAAERARLEAEAAKARALLERQRALQAASAAAAVAMQRPRAGAPAATPVAPRPPAAAPAVGSATAAPAVATPAAPSAATAPAAAPRREQPLFVVRRAGASTRRTQGRRRPAPEPPGAPLVTRWD